MFGSLLLPRAANPSEHIVFVVGSAIGTSQCLHASTAQNAHSVIRSRKLVTVPPAPFLKRVWSWKMVIKRGQLELSPNVLLAAHVGSQYLRNFDATVRLLVVLEDSDYRSAHCQARAV